LAGRNSAAARACAAARSCGVLVAAAPDRLGRLPVEHHDEQATPGEFIRLARDLLPSALYDLLRHRRLVGSKNLYPGFSSS
jgi:hypothetical protein